MSMYCTGTFDSARNAPAGMRCTSTITLLIEGRMRSGVCGQRGSGGNAFSVAAGAMPARSAPSLVADGVTERVVDALEAVEVDDEHPDALRPLAERLLQPLLEVAAVRD